MPRASSSWVSLMGLTLKDVVVITGAKSRKYNVLMEKVGVRKCCPIQLSVATTLPIRGWPLPRLYYRETEFWSGRRGLMSGLAGSPSGSSRRSVYKALLDSRCWDT